MAEETTGHKLNPKDHLCLEGQGMALDFESKHLTLRKMESVKIVDWLLLFITYEKHNVLWRSCFSQFCSNRSRWIACILSVLLHFGPMHCLLEEYGKESNRFCEEVKLVCFHLMTHYFLLMQSHANSTTIWERISKHKKPVVEPRQSSLFLLSIEVTDMTYKQSVIFLIYKYIVFPHMFPRLYCWQDYMAKLKDTSASGAVFFAVCRGKVCLIPDFSEIVQFCALEDFFILCWLMNIDRHLLWTFLLSYNRGFWKSTIYT